MYTSPDMRWCCCEHVFEKSCQPRLMGIVNVTPDSFSDGGAFFSTETAVQQALSLASQGADILDIGGESTRPGSLSVAEDEEIRRVIPVIREVRKHSPQAISVDTTKAQVARKALEAGAWIINDISGLTFDTEMVAVARDFKAGVIINHIQGTPQTMQHNPVYTDVVQEVFEFFERRIDQLIDGGISAESICLDPGIGFGKTAAHNLSLLRAIPHFRKLGRPMLVGHSRKRFLKQLTGREVNEREYGTLGVSLALAQLGVDFLRIHDVAAHRDSLLAYGAVALNIDPERSPQQK